MKDRYSLVVLMIIIALALSACGLNFGTFSTWEIIEANGEKIVLENMKCGFERHEHLLIRCFENPSSGNFRYEAEIISARKLNE